MTSVSASGYIQKSSSHHDVKAVTAKFGPEDAELKITGPAPAVACRAWVSFNARKNAAGVDADDATARLILASNNVTSVVRGTTGIYKVNFTKYLPSWNYVVVGTAANAEAKNGLVADPGAVQAVAAKSNEAAAIYDNASKTDRFCYIYVTAQDGLGVPILATHVTAPTDCQVAFFA